MGWWWWFACCSGSPVSPDHTWAQASKKDSHATPGKKWKIKTASTPRSFNFTNDKTPTDIPFKKLGPCIYARDEVILCPSKFCWATSLWDQKDSQCPHTPMRLKSRQFCTLWNIYLNMIKTNTCSTKYKININELFILSQKIYISFIIWLFGFIYRQDDNFMKVISVVCNL